MAQYLPQHTPDSEGLEVASSHRGFDSDKQVYATSGQYPAYGHGYEPVHQPYGPSAGDRPRRRRRRWILIGAAFAALVVVGAVVGGVVGSMRATGGDKQNPPPDSSSSPSSEPKKKLILMNSALAVSGYADETSYRSRLFWQGPDQQIRYARWDHKDRSAEGSWSNPVDTIVRDAVGRTAIGASMVLTQGAQYEVFYISEDGRMSGVNFIDNVLAPDGGVDSVVERKYPGGSNKTTIGNYWPLIDYNPGSGNVQQFAYNSTIQPAWTLPGPLSASGAVAGSPDTKVLVLPVTLNYSAVFPFVRVVYHRSDGQLGEFIRDAGSGEVLAPTGIIAPAKPARGTAIAGFAYGRSGSDKAVNTYVLYRTEDGSISYVWQDDDSGNWKGPKTDDVFKSADKGSQITCLTLAADVEVKVKLRSDTESCRCYFQDGNGDVNEVHFDGRGWKSMGKLSIE